MNKKDKIISIEEACNIIKSGNTVMVGGFMGTGAPHSLIDALIKTNIKDLTIICNDGGFGPCDIYKDGFGCGKLIINKMASSLIATHIGLNNEVAIQKREGTLKVKLYPQGSLIEKIRCGGFGLGGVLTPTGIGSDIVEKGKKIININSKDYLLEEAIKGDVAIIGAKKADKYGNIIFHGSTRTFGELMVYACTTNIIEVEEIVDTLDPDFIHIPAPFVKNIILKNG